MADMTEREAWNGLLDAFTRMRDFSRALALLRGDQRWLAIAGISDQCKDQCTKLFTKSSRQGSAPVVTPAGQRLILPPGVRRGS